MTQPARRDLIRLLENDLGEHDTRQLELACHSSPGAQAELDALRQLRQDLTAPADGTEVDLLPQVRAALLERARRPPSRASWWALLWAGGGALAAAAVALLVFVPTQEREEVRIKSAAPDRPEASRWAGVEIFRVPPGAQPVRLEGWMHRDDGLAFVYRNGGSTPFSHLMVFATDARGQSYWYHPAWERADQDPASVAVAPSATAMELPDAVVHALEPGPLVIHALFTRQPLRASEVEALLAAGKLSLSGGFVQSLPIRVEE